MPRIPTLLLPLIMVVLCMSIGGVRAVTTQIKIHGLTTMSENQALGLLGNMIEQVAGNAPSPSRADDAAFLLERTLRKQGHPEATVSWSLTQGQNVIHLTVEQGSAQYIGSIHVSGVNEALQKEIQPYFKSEPFGFLLLPNKKIPYIPSNLEEAIENAKSHLHAKGYWTASTKLTKTKFHEETGLVDLYIAITPGPLYRLSPPEIRGPSPIDLAPLRKKLDRLNEKPANTQNIKAARSTTLDFFTSQGFSFAEVELDQQLTGDHAKLILTIAPGNKYLVGKVNIIGLKRTDPAVIHRRINKGYGKLYNPSKMQRARRRLLASGAFESILIDDTPRNDGYIDLTLRMQEGRARSRGAYIGAGSYEGPIFGLSYQDRNFLGKLYNLAISAEYSGLGLLGQTSITDPMFLGTNLSLTLRTFILNNEFPGYTKLEAGLGSELVWKINDHYSLRFHADFMIAQSSPNGLPEEELGYQHYTVGRVGATQKLDFRDNPVNPRKGFYGELLTEVGTANGDSSIPYSRVILRTTYRQPINADQFFVFSGRAGMIVNNDSENFPIDLRYFLGGSDSMRSFKDLEMPPYVDGDPVGGEAFWIGSIDYNRKIKGPVYMNLFTDAGALSPLASDLGSADIKYAAGLGFWLNLPIGPISASYGYNLNRAANEPAGAFHFTIGVNF
jgi:outer membrane protein insertion porin family